MSGSRGMTPAQEADLAARLAAYGEWTRAQGGGEPPQGAGAMRRGQEGPQRTVTAPPPGARGSVRLGDGPVRVLPPPSAMPDSLTRPLAARVQPIGPRRYADPLPRTPASSEGASSASGPESDMERAIRLSLEAQREAQEREAQELQQALASIAAMEEAEARAAEEAAQRAAREAAERAAAVASTTFGGGAGAGSARALDVTGFSQTDLERAMAMSLLETERKRALPEPAPEALRSDHYFAPLLEAVRAINPRGDFPEAAFELLKARMVAGLQAGRLGLSEVLSTLIHDAGPRRPFGEMERLIREACDDARQPEKTNALIGQWRAHTYEMALTQSSKPVLESAIDNYGRGDCLILTLFTGLNILEGKDPKDGIGSPGEARARIDGTRAALALKFRERILDTSQRGAEFRREFIHCLNSDALGFSHGLSPLTPDETERFIRFGWSPAELGDDLTTKVQRNLVTYDQRLRNVRPDGTRARVTAENNQFELKLASEYFNRPIIQFSYDREGFLQHTTIIGGSLLPPAGEPFSPENTPLVVGFVPGHYLFPGSPLYQSE